MKNMLAIYKREMESYFTSQTFYIISAVFIFVIGNMYKNVFFEFAQKSMQLLKYSWNYGDSNLTFINVNVVSMQTFQYMNFVLLLIVPLLTMRLYSEEKKMGTMELLLTSPIKTSEVLLGKFLSCFTIYTFMVMLTVAFMVILDIQSKGQLDVRPIISSYAGTLLLGAALIPIGMFASSLTENQIISAVISLSIMLGLWVLIFSSQFFGSPFNEIVAFISLPEHLESFSLGFIGIKHIVYYISMSLFWLVLTGMSVESARWRQ